MQRGLLKRLIGAKLICTEWTSAQPGKLTASRGGVSREQIQKSHESRRRLSSHLPEQTDLAEHLKHLVETQKGQALGLL